MFAHSILLVGAIAFLMAGVTANAQPADADPPASAPAATELAPVTVTAVRDPALLPYAPIGALLRRLAQHGQGLFHLDFRLVAKDPAKAFAAPIALTLRQADRDAPIPVQADGRFTLPVLSAEQAEGAEVAVNQAKGTVAVRGTIRLTTPPAELDLATVRRIVATAGTLRGELLPWYSRWLFPKVDAVRICSRRAAWTVQWADPNGQWLAVTLPADPAKHDETDRDDGAAAKARVCTALSGQEPWPGLARLVSDADTTLSVEWNR